MRPRFDVRVVSVEDTHELPEAWSLSDYRALLAELDFDDAHSVVEAEARELCMMALAELGPEDSAEIVLRHRLGSTLRKGQIEDIAHDIVDEPLWEDYPDMRVHEELYNVNQLLYDAYGGRFPRPRAIRVVVEARPVDDEGSSMLEEPSEAFLVRLLGGGLSPDSVLHRLFEDSLRGPVFPEAEFIVWRYEHTSAGPGVTSFTIFGSAYWLESLEDTDDYEATGFPDARAR